MINRSPPSHVPYSLDDPIEAGHWSILYVFPVINHAAAACDHTSEGHVSSDHVSFTCQHSPKTKYRAWSNTYLYFLMSFLLMFLKPYHLNLSIRSQSKPPAWHLRSAPSLPSVPSGTTAWTPTTPLYALAVSSPGENTRSHSAHSHSPPGSSKAGCCPQEHLPSGR